VAAASTHFATPPRSASPVLEEVVSATFDPVEPSEGSVADREGVSDVVDAAAVELESLLAAVSPDPLVYGMSAAAAAAAVGLGLAAALSVTRQGLQEDFCAKVDIVHAAQPARVSTGKMRSLRCFQVVSVNCLPL